MAAGLNEHAMGKSATVTLSWSVSVLATFDRMASVLPFVESSEESSCVCNTELSQRERRTGARFLGLSTAVGDHRFGEPS